MSIFSSVWYAPILSTILGRMRTFSWAMKYTRLIIALVAALLFSCHNSDEPQSSRSPLEYLQSISGKKILSGQHNREPNSDPAKWTQWIFETTGKYPALWGGDFLFQAENIEHRWTMIEEARKQWEGGAVISIMWHACNPALGGEPCGWQSSLLTTMSDESWTELITEGTQLNKVWKSMMDEVAVYLEFLQDNQVEVLFRPLHEMNQGAFWWGGRPGPNGTARLYRLTHDYFTNTKGLSNLIWVWDLQDFNSLESDLLEYNPGNEYWDVLALDFYEGGYSIDKYNNLVEAAGDKPIAIGECTTLPTPEELEQQPRWTFFMPWAELVTRDNTVEKIRALYDSPRVLTR